VIAGGVAYVFRHYDLGLLGRIVVQDITGSQCLVSLEVAGDPEDPMTDRRLSPVRSSMPRATRASRKSRAARGWSVRRATNVWRSKGPEARTVKRSSTMVLNRVLELQQALARY